ncbi:MAG: LPXTG cell wall anchor domain-containing protein [Actinomycetota bacterium]
MKRLLLAVSAAFVLTIAVAAPAGAQTVSIDPNPVSEAGEQEITVTGTGFTDDGFLLACPGANADPAQLAEDSCDLVNLTPYSAGDWELTVTFDVPEEGLLIVAGNAAQTEVVPAVISVGAAEDGAAEELPNTGGNTETYLLLAAVLFGAAAAFTMGGRKLQQV